VEHTLTRRAWLAGTPAILATAATAADQKATRAFRYCLNTATIMGENLPLAEEIDIAGRAGYDAVEPWISKIEKHVKDGGNLKDIAKRARDHGLTIPSAIGFYEWIVDDEARRKKGFAETKRAMEMVRQIGGQRLASPPAGATETSGLDLLKVADRYRALLEVGDRYGVTPMAEVWGFSKTLGRLGEAAFVAIETGHPQACILADVYHLYKGGSGYGGVRLLAGSALPVVHMNDYPADPPRATITDAHRVYPGDGVAPLKTLLRDLRGIGFQGYLSLEVFNRGYWKEDAISVARTGLEKMRAVVQASME
jgi:sugar phosphate isomerase/epimerase